MAPSRALESRSAQLLTGGLLIIAKRAEKVKHLPAPETSSRPVPGQT